MDEPYIASKGATHTWVITSLKTNNLTTTAHIGANASVKSPNKARQRHERPLRTMVQTGVTREIKSDATNANANSYYPSSEPQAWASTMASDASNQYINANRSSYMPQDYDPAYGLNNTPPKKRRGPLIAGIVIAIVLALVGGAAGAGFALLNEVKTVKNDALAIVDSASAIKDAPSSRGAEATLKPLPATSIRAPLA